MEARPELETLLRHADWLARLARRLVSDAAAAEDLVQETWIAALRRPPDPDRPARPWLAGVIRKLALLRGRRESRQVASAWPSAEAAPSAEESAAQVELERTVAGAVLALDEPFRSAILLRYYRGLSSVEIGRELGVPDATVRTRIKRGLERLRVRLDQVHGGDGRTWISALAPLVALDRGVPVAGALWTGGGIVTKWIVGAVAAVVALVLVRSSWESAASPAIQPPAAAVEAGGPATETADALEKVDEDAERVAVVDLDVAEPDADRTTSSVPGAEEAILRGRFLLPGGGPAVDVALLLQGWIGNKDREREFGVPESWEDLRGNSDSEGRFELRFLPPRAFQFTLDAEQSGYPRVSWRWYEVLPGSITELGEVTLRRAGVIVGRVLDTQEPPQAIAWHVEARSIEPCVPGGELIDEQVAADPVTGEFRFDAFPEGPASLSATAPGIRADGPRIEVLADVVNEATIYFRAPPVTGQIHVTTFTYPFGEFLPEPSALRLESGGTRLATAERDGRSQENFFFNDVAPGSYDIFIEDERFEPWSRSGVQPGELVVARLAGNAGVVLEVSDAVSYELIPHYQLDLVYLTREGDQFSQKHCLLGLRDDPPEDGYFGGLVPHDCKLVVSAEGYSATEFSLGGLAPGERRTLHCGLVSGTGLAGHVFDSAGNHAENVPVELHPGEIEMTELCSPEFRRRLRNEQREPLVHVSDQSGNFTFEHLAAGTWTLCASASPTVVARAVVTLAGEEQVDVDLHFPAAAFLSGHVLLPETMSRGELELAVLAADSESTRLYLPHPGGAIDVVRSEVGAQGEFRLGPFGAGDWIVVVALPCVELPIGYSGMLSYAGEAFQLERLHLEGGEEIEREYDLRATFGSLRVDAKVNGAPAAKTVLEVVSGTSWENPAAGAGLDQDGIARIPSLPPGEWHLVLRDIENRWRYGHPAPIRIVGGEEARVSVEAVLYDGQLEVHLTGSGEPLANVMLSWTCETPGFQLLGQSRADARGIVETELAPGLYRMSSKFPPGEEAVEVEWSSAGPSPRSIELPPAGR